MTIEQLYILYLNSGCRVSTDSRTIEGGEIFFSLKGENFDGNKYALAAIEKGAAWAIVDDRQLDGQNEQVILVDNVFLTLQELAIYHREHICEGNLPVLALTGTNGKTTTKNLISAVLSTKYRVCATKGNLNNDIGVPLSLLSMKPDCQIAVIEMGASHIDDIAKLVKVCKPDYGLITNIGKAHLEGFVDLEGVITAKTELYKWLGTHRASLIFINEDDAILRTQAYKQACHLYGYGIDYQGAIILPPSLDHPFLRLKLSDRTIETKLIGGYNATNVLAALAVGEYFGVDREAAIEAVENFEPQGQRSLMLKTRTNTLYVDAYNANPSSMSAALDNFLSARSDSKVALLGDMKELGKDSLCEHIAIVKRLMTSDANVYLVGSEFSNAVRLVPGCDFLCFETSAELAEHLNNQPIIGSLVLIKGSRSTQMERCLDSL